MNSYIALNNQSFSKGNRSIVPIRMEDCYLIMKWRNEQIFHLRQNKPLTNNDQDHYFNSTVIKLFKDKQPSQLLFSYLEDDKCIGYGGLVHMNWIDRNAEISFITDTIITGQAYASHMSTFLDLITEVAFTDIHFHKLFTFAFDVRPHIYPIIEDSGFKKEAILKEHCLFNGVFKDVVIHTKYNRKN